MRKLFSTLLVGAMLILVLGGCGSEPPKTEEGSCTITLVEGGQPAVITITATEKSVDIVKVISSGFTTYSLDLVNGELMGYVSGQLPSFWELQTGTIVLEGQVVGSYNSDTNTYAFPNSCH